MQENSLQLYEFILRQCAAKRPEPWYPSTYVPPAGTSRSDLDLALDDLRLGGLIQLSPWEPGQGQGYTLTEAGTQIASSPSLLNKLRAWKPSPIVVASPPAQPGFGTRTTALERGDAVRDTLLYYSSPWVTRFLILLNVIVYLGGIWLAHQRGIAISKFLTESDQEILNQLGAYTSVELLSGQWWRLLTTTFVHLTWWHIGMNMLALWSFGQLSERMFGRLGFLILYLLSGLGGSVTAAIIDPLKPTVGASGAICGLGAAMACWIYLNRGFLPQPLTAKWLGALRNTAVYIIIISLLPNVSWAAHLGGAVTGLLAGAALTELRFGSGLQRLLAGLGLAALPAVGAGAILCSQSLDPRWDEIRAWKERKEWLLERRPKVEAIWQIFDSKRETFYRVPRNKESVKETLASISEAKQLLQQAVDILEKDGTSHDSRVERQRSDWKERITGIQMFLTVREKKLRDKL